MFARCQVCQKFVGLGGGICFRASSDAKIGAREREIERAQAEAWEICAIMLLKLDSCLLAFYVGQLSKRTQSITIYVMYESFCEEV